MRRLWSPQRGQTPQVVADEVFLAQAQVLCVGSDRDEGLVQRVAEVLKDATSRQMNICGQGGLPKWTLQRHEPAYITNL